jgi:hypothetical protein
MARRKPTVFVCRIDNPMFARKRTAFQAADTIDPSVIGLSAQNRHQAKKP